MVNKQHKIVDFLVLLQNDFSEVFSEKIVWLTGSYQPLVIQEFLRLIKKQNLFVQHVRETDLADLLLSLHTISVVERVSFFWLSDIGVYDADWQLKFLEFASSYSGPHLLAFFSSELPGKKRKGVGIKVEIDNVIEKPQCVQLWRAGGESGDSLVWVEKVITKIFSHRATLPIESSILLKHYAVLLKENTYEALQPWLDDIVLPDYSLYTLASYFFAKNTAAFFTLWKNMSQEYPEQFWIAFWSEQLFRAYWFVSYQQKSENVKAQKIGLRLPFSFLKKDYKKSTCSELHHTHNDLYKVEWGLKNGFIMGLERLYLKFMIGHYNKS